MWGLTVERGMSWEEGAKGENWNHSNSINNKTFFKRDSLEN